MRLIIDTETKTLDIERSDGVERHPLYSRAAFEAISDQWLRVGWNEKYPYNFSWMGRPIIQSPEDMLRTQEVLWSVRPDLIIETGVAHGGSLVYYASLFEAMGGGRVLGVDIEIRPHNRRAIEAHPMAHRITLIEGDSVSGPTLAEVASHVRPDDTVLVILDSCHSYDHVSRELEAYHAFVTRDSYIVATDGIMRDLHDVPRGNPSWKTDNPAAAAEDFAKRNSDFVLEQPPWPFRESELVENITHWPRAWLRRT